MLVTVLVLFVFQVKCDPYLVDQGSTHFPAILPLPGVFEKMKIQQMELQRQGGRICRGNNIQRDCAYDEATKTAQVWVPDTRNVGWMGFQMYPNTDRKGSITVFFSDARRYDEVMRRGCILPYYSSPGIINAQEINIVTITCARKIVCPENDNTFIMYVDGYKKCEKDGTGTGTASNVPCKKVGERNGEVFLYSLDILRPTPLPNDGKTYVYGESARTTISFVIDWMQNDNPYVVNQASGPYLLSVPLPSDYNRLRIQNNDFTRDTWGKCHSGSTQYRCNFDMGSKTANILLPETRNVGPVHIEVTPPGLNEKRFITVTFTDGGTWEGVHRYSCLFPYYSSPSLIKAKYLQTVTIRCARKRTCRLNDRPDNYLSLSIEGAKKCEKDGRGTGTAPNAPCRKEADFYDDAHVYTLDVSRPTPLPANGKTTIYCHTERTALSFVIDWNGIAAIADPYQVDQPGGPYKVSIPVPMEFQKMKYDNRLYDRLSNGMCRHIPPGGGSAYESRCSYDSSTKTASVDIWNTRTAGWVGFEMFSSSAQKGYQTVFLTQGGTWSVINTHGCILPQYSSPSAIYTTDQTILTIKCARKKTCKNNDNTLIMSIEGTKKCEKDGRGTVGDPNSPCRRVATWADVDVYSLDVSKPVISNDGYTYVYCGTRDSQMSFTIYWNSHPDPYRVNKASGPYLLSVPFPMPFHKLKIMGTEYERVNDEMCFAVSNSRKCFYDPENKTANILIPETRHVGWVAFEMYHGSQYQKGSITAYFTDDGEMSAIDWYGCILPYYSSAGLIRAKYLTSVTIQCARKTVCHNNDNTLQMYVDGWKKCEKDGSGTHMPSNAPCRKATDIYDDAHLYMLDVSRPTPLPADGKTYVYCETDRTQLSFVIDWNSVRSIDNPHRVDQDGGLYTVSIPVPTEFHKLKYDNQEYDRLPYGICRHIPPNGGNPKEVRCDYDAYTKTASILIRHTLRTAWVGFEMFSSSAQKGYQTVFFTQGGTWSRINDIGCILPQHSSPSVMYGVHQTTVTIKCARKKTCSNNDNILIMSIEGTKKCEKDGRGTGTDPDVPCTRDVAASKDVDVYTLDVLKPRIPFNDGKTYVYCGTSTSQISFVIEWNFNADPYRVNQASGAYELHVPVPTDFQKLKIKYDEFERHSGVCLSGSKEHPCSYNPVSATIRIPDTRRFGWVAFAMYPQSFNQKGYITTFFTEEGKWQDIDSSSCILPYYSSPSIINAKKLNSVSVKFARKSNCPSNDQMLYIYVDGWKKCEKDGGNGGLPENYPCRREQTIYDDAQIYSYNVNRPTPLPSDGRTYVYGETEISALSVVIDWTKTEPIRDVYRVDQVGGIYDVTIPVPMAFSRVKIDNRDYDLMPNGTCRNSSGTEFIKCGYDERTKTASILIRHTLRTAWVGFEMFSSSAEKGYQTVFFTQGGTWSRNYDIGCIVPQHSSPSVIYAGHQNTVTIKCARKRGCNNNDNTLIMSIEGTKKCEKDGRGTGGDPNAPCEGDELPWGDVEVYSLDVLKPEIPTNGGKTYVYCGTSTSQFSVIVDWTTKPCKTSILVTPLSHECRIRGRSWIYDQQTNTCVEYGFKFSTLSTFCNLVAIQNSEAALNNFQTELECQNACFKTL